MVDHLASRILHFPLTRLVLAIVMVVAPVVAVQIPLSRRHLERTPFAIPLAALAALLGYAGYRAYVHWIERREPVELGFAGALPELGRGMIFGALLFTATIGILRAAGVYSVGAVNSVAVLAYPLAGSLVSGVVEEILFRGVLFRIVEESLGTWLALLTSALVFGLAHLANPGANLVAASAIMIEAGILLAAAYLFTRRLWLPIGLHFAWNFTEAGVFGAGVSGRHIPGLLTARFAGPDWLTGGAFGPEASIVAVGLCLTAGVALLVAAWRRDHFVRPFWRRAAA